MFVNISNHDSSKWHEAQLNAAKLFGDIQDIKFPQVNPSRLDSEYILRLADSVLTQLAPKARVVMVQGEYSLTFALVKKLQARKIRCLVACSERQVNPVNKEQSFNFKGFRELV